MTTTKGSRDLETLHTIGHGRGSYVNVKRGYGARVLAELEFDSFLSSFLGGNRVISHELMVW
jgi:hypothetical protein